MSPPDGRRRDDRASSPSIDQVLRLQQQAGNQAVAGLLGRRTLARLVVTASDPDVDPLTAATIPFAEKEAQGPSMTFKPGISYREHQTVLYLGHGKAGGELTGVDVNLLIDELTHRGRGMQGGSTLKLWSCFAGRPTAVAPSLVNKITDAFGLAGITGVTVSGVPGALYTNTADDTLYSGPPPDTEARKDLFFVGKDAWIGCGLVKMEKQHARETPAGTFDLAYAPNTASPKTLDEAIKNLVEAGKLDAVPTTLVEKKKAVEAAVRDLNRRFFEHPVVKYYIKSGDLTLVLPAEMVSAISELLAATDTAEIRDPGYQDYMRERRDRAEAAGGDF